MDTLTWNPHVSAKEKEAVALSRTESIIEAVKDESWKTEAWRFWTMKVSIGRRTSPNTAVT